MRGKRYGYKPTVHATRDWDLPRGIRRVKA